MGVSECRSGASSRLRIVDGQQRTLQLHHVETEPEADQRGRNHGCPSTAEREALVVRFRRNQPEQVDEARDDDGIATADRPGLRLMPRINSRKNGTAEVEDDQRDAERNPAGLLTMRSTT